MEGGILLDMCDGYAGKILEIDLTTRFISSFPLPDVYRKQLLGGKALAAQLLYTRTTGTESALSEENLLVIATAPLTGSGAPGTARFDIASLSAKDDLPAFSNCSSDFGRLLKKAGYDALIIKGKCACPSWLEISGETVVFHDANALWGTNTGACRQALQQQAKDNRFASICIGPAGENLVKYASVLADGHSMGRAGLGAVMGWKQLKAVTVSGQQKIAFADEVSVSELNRQWYEQLRSLVPTSPGKNDCDRCPLRCVRHGRKTDLILDDLGMDAMEAEAALRWAKEQGIDTTGVYEAIAYRQGIGDQLSEGVARERKQGSDRRKVNYEQLATAFGLSAEGEETAVFCKNIIEAVSVCGQCIFTLRALQAPDQEMPLLKMIEYVTGQPCDITNLLSLGEFSHRLVQELKQRFTDKKSTS